MIISDLNIILPEIILSVYAMLALVGAVYAAKDELATTLCWLTSILFAIVAFWISSDSASAQTAFNGMFIDDGFARFAKVVILLSAAYALWLYRRVVMGDLIKESLKSITDMGTRERVIFAPLVVMTLLLGVYPALALDVIAPAVENLVSNYNAAVLDAGLGQVADAANAH